jgi:hypothetical protein
MVYAIPSKHHADVRLDTGVELARHVERGQKLATQ